MQTPFFPENISCQSACCCPHSYTKHVFTNLFFACLYFENIKPLDLPLCHHISLFTLQSQGNECQQALNGKHPYHGDSVCTLPFLLLEVQRLFFLRNSGVDSVCVDNPPFWHLVNTDAVMASSGHFSSVTSVEVVPSTVAGGLKPEVPLLASEEGMEWYRNG